MIMTKHEFKMRWESSDDGGGITFNDVADCAKEWGLFSTPRVHNINTVVYTVLKAAGTEDCESYNTKE